MKKVTVTTVLFFFGFVIQAWALDLGIDSNKSKSIERDKSLSVKNVTDKKHNTGEKTAKSTSSGSDLQDQDTIKNIDRQMRSSVLDITLSLGDMFSVSMSMLEIRNNIPNLKAHIFTNPRLPAHFGLSAEIQPGVIDTIKAELLNKMAASNSLLENIGVDTQKIKRYRNDLALYGVIMAQAYLNFSKDLSLLDAGSRDKSGRINIKTIGYDDLQNLADGALLRAAQHLENKRLRTIYTAIQNDQGPCRFAGTVTSVQCGYSVMSLSNPPALTALGMTVFSRDRYAGFTGTYRISSNWSYDKVIEKMKSISRYRKIAEETSKYAEKLESQGKSREAVMVKKLAWNTAKTGKISLSLARLIPGIN